MNSYTSFISATLFLSVSYLPNQAFSADVLGENFDDCTCVTSASSAGSQLGKITLANGEVVNAGISGVETASSGTPILNGSEITTGSGSAKISVGASCNLSVGPNSVASVFQSSTGGPICVKVAEAVGGPAIASGATPVAAAGPSPLVALGILGGIGGAALLLGGGDDPASN